MNRVISALILALLTVATPAAAQRGKKATAAKKKNVVVEQPAEDPRITAMRESTQRIIIVDSIVTDKQAFLQQYVLSADAGTLSTYADFFQDDSQPYAVVYKNELGNKCYFSQSGRLMTSDLLNGQWSKPDSLQGMGLFDRLNYPYVMADGTTLYFAATGEESIGGLDIFVTRYDSNTGQFLRAENVGMPFNSEANDYMMAIDEMAEIGYFASDRNQPDGKVCIYIFVPNKTRQTYDSEAYTEQQLKSLSRIDRIADTWGSKSVRQDALKRLETLRSATADVKSRQEQTIFYVDDDTPILSAADFKVLENRSRYAQLVRQQQRLAEIEAQLEKSRQQYADANSEERTYLETEIVTNEHEFQELQLLVRQTEKDIRNAEIQSRQ